MTEDTADVTILEEAREYTFPVRTFVDCTYVIDDVEVTYIDDVAGYTFMRPVHGDHNP